MENGLKDAQTSMILGIIGCALIVTGFGGVVSFVLGIIGLGKAKSAQLAGVENGQRTAGFVLNLISVIIGAIVFAIVLITVCCGGCLACASIMY